VGIFKENSFFDTSFLTNHPRSERSWTHIQTKDNPILIEWIQCKPDKVNGCSDLSDIFRKMLFMSVFEQELIFILKKQIDFHSRSFCK